MRERKRAGGGVKIERNKEVKLRKKDEREEEKRDDKVGSGKSARIAERQR